MTDGALRYSLPTDPDDASTADGTVSVDSGARCSRGLGGGAPARLDTCIGTTPHGGEAGLPVGVSPEGDSHGSPGGWCTGWGRRGRTFGRAVLRRPGDALYGRRCAEAPVGRGVTRCPVRSSRRRCRAPSPWRHAYGRMQRRSWRSYARGVADVVAELGYGSVARRLMVCGTTADVHTCEACCDPHACVIVRAGCDVRGCPWCARRRAAEESARVCGAAERVAGYVSARAPARLAQLATERAALEAPGRRRTARAVARLAQVKRAAGSITRRAGWGWKLLTISPRWSPSSVWDYSVGGLRARLDDLRARWAALWGAGLDCGGLAGAYLRVELSAGGHIHAHVLYYGPYLQRRWASGVAGCFVDIKAINGDELRRGVRETVKYVLKSPSPLRAWWIAGARNRTPHVRLAGAWIVATRGRRLAEPYGVMRDALTAHDACGDGASTSQKTAVRACASCGSESISDARREATAVVARALRHRWRFHPTRAGDLSAVRAFPARITVSRV